MQEADRRVDRFPREGRLVSLDVDHNLGVGNRKGRLGDAVGAARRRRVGHDRLAAERADRVVDRGVVARDDDAARQTASPRSFVGVLNQRLTRLGQEEFAGQTRRGETGGDDDDTLHADHSS